MTYPISQLAIIAPILFIVLLLSNVVIGIFGGWKRAAYWGGGNFLFYVIGLIVVKTANTQLANLISPLLTSLLQSLKISTEQILNLSKSLIIPIFFIALFLLGNLILLINYYAWFRRITKIKLETQIKKAIKLFKKNNINNPEQVLRKLIPLKKQEDIEKEIAISKEALVKLSKYKELYKLQVAPKTLVQTSKQKAINMSCGAIAMTGLMLPALSTFTSTTYYLTSTTATRKTNSFSAGVYSLLENSHSSLNWFSYYGNNEGTDFDAALSALALNTQTIEITYYDADGNQQTASGNPIDVVTQVIPTGVEKLIDTIENCIGTEATQEKTTYQDVVNSSSNFANTWNQIVDKVGDELSGVLSSNNAVDLISSMITGQSASGMKITSDMIKTITEQENVYSQVISQYQEIQKEQATSDEQISKDITIKIDEKEITLENVVTMKQLEVSNESYENLKETLGNFIDSSELNETEKTKFNELIDTVTSMMFKIK